MNTTSRHPEEHNPEFKSGIVGFFIELESPSNSEGSELQSPNFFYISQRWELLLLDAVLTIAL